MISFIAERTESTESSRGIRIDELLDDYAHWCTEAALGPLRFEEFVRALDHLRVSLELRGKIKKCRTRRFGIALVATRGAAGARS